MMAEEKKTPFPPSAAHRRAQRRVPRLLPALSNSKAPTTALVAHLLVLFLLGVACVVAAWDSIRSFWHHSEALALSIGLVVLIVLFAVLMWKKTSEISELRGLMHGLEQRDAEPPSDKQLDQLFEIIARSQQGYRDLIDSFVTFLLALSLDGQIRAVNRSFSDLVDTPFQQISAEPLTEFVLDVPGDGGELVKRAMPRFYGTPPLGGVVQIRLKSQSSVFYFDCVAHAMMRADKDSRHYRPRAPT